MAYRRRQGGTPKSETYKEETYNDSDDDDPKKYDHQRSISFGNDPGSLAARASASHRDSSGFGSAYAALDHSPSPTSSSASPSNYFRHPDPDSSHHFRSKRSFVSQSNSNKDRDDPRYGFWGILAQKAKSILDEDDRFDSSNRMKSQINEIGSQFYRSRQFSESSPKVDNARLRKGLDGIKSSLNNFGDALGEAFEEGRTMVAHRTPDLIRETSNKTADIRLQMRRRGGGSSDTQDQATVLQNTSWQRPMIQPVQVNPLANQETQLKASRDVAMATAAKAKVLLRELKTVKADLAFAKERCSQLEEENKRLRESREKGDNPDDDDDLIRLQLETLLAEKARLAHENSVYARENRFLREIVEYHQLTMQEVVYLDEGAEEVTEVYPFSIDDARVLSSTPTSPISPYCLPEDSSLAIPAEVKEHTTDTDEVCNLVTSLPQPSSLPEVCGSRSSPEKTESSKVLTPSLKVVEKEIEASHNTQPQIAIAEDPKRPAVSSA